MRYAAQSQKILTAAAGKARLWGHSYVGSEHLLLALAEDGDLAGQLLCFSGGTVPLLEKMVTVLCGTGTGGLPLPQGFTPEMKRILTGARTEALVCGEGCIRPIHMLLSILRQDDTAASDILMF